MSNFAPQGVRQILWKNRKFIDGQILTPGESITLCKTVDLPLECVDIAPGTIGVVHVCGDADTTVSIIRDDCKAARKALNKK